MDPDENQASASPRNRTMALWLYHSTTLMVHESTIMRPQVRAEPAIPRYEVYQRCLNSTKAWLDVFFSVPLDMYTCLPCSIYCQLFYVVGCLRKITTIRDTAWDPSAARGIVDLVPTLDRIIHTFEQLNASAMAGSARHQEDEVLNFGLKKFHAFKMAWQSDPSEAASSSKDRGGGGGAFPQASMPVNGTDAEGSYNPTLPMEYFGFNMLPSLLDDDSWL
ncbi:hypothetical protein VMCG_01785 [Cytospora schulzeri]|uniref:Transcription factor domain-containing protein n=1 Tax=Cytospora schulzeri TaxID=448051 RepID=A0A423X3G8_9PEZI|nr:hypothetical protein VMCG_01785 [Valsa malicola]